LSEMPNRKNIHFIPSRLVYLIGDMDKVLKYDLHGDKWSVID
jgi:hypothetical protein